MNQKTIQNNCKHQRKLIPTSYLHVTCADCGKPLKLANIGTTKVL